MSKNTIVYRGANLLELIDSGDYELFEPGKENGVSKLMRPILDNADESLKDIEKQLYKLPSLVNVIRTSIPKTELHAVLTKGQQKALAEGALKLLTKKDGSMLATLVNPETNRLVAAVPLEMVERTPELATAMTSFSTQLQMAQIAEQIQAVQTAVEEVRQGLENDRLATAYSCQQKLIQAMAIKNPQLKEMAMLNLISDAEDSRNRLMLSQQMNVKFITDQPEDFIGKMISGAKTEEIKKRMDEIRSSLYAVNMVSLAEAVAYQQIGEMEASVKSIQYYGAFIKENYLAEPRLVERLDMIDPSEKNYWSINVPEIEKKINMLPCMNEVLLTTEDK